MQDTLTVDPVDASQDRSGGAYPPGHEIGRYVLAQLIGTGATSVVYAAYDPQLGRTVALKLIAGGEGSRGERLIKEARALAAMNHPNVVTVHDAGAAGDTTFIAMERIEGGTLTRWRDADPPRRERMHVLALAGQGLLAAHEAELVHRDFKPDNVMIADDGRVVVLDFGLVQHAPRDTRAAALVEDAKGPSAGGEGRVGTPAYMAPEQYDEGISSARSDQFSFCVVVWESLHGERPFGRGPLAEVMARVPDGPREIPRGRRVNPRLHRALLRGLARRPEDRHDSLLPIIEALQQRKTSRVLVAAAFGVTAVTAGALSVSARPDVGCGDPTVQVDAAWTSARRDALQQIAGGEVVAVEPADRYAEQLRETWITACAATDGGTLAAFEGLERCLLLRRHALSATLDALAGLQAPEVRVIVDAVERLPDPARCLSDPGRRPPPPTPAAMGTVSALERELDLARTQRWVGNPHEAQRQLDALDPEIVAHGYRPQLAQLRLERALVASELSAADGTARLEEAYALAVEAKDHGTAALAASALAHAFGTVDGRHHAANAWATVARAHLPNTDLGPTAHLRLDETLAGLAFRQGRIEQALSMYRVALARAVAELPANADTALTLRSNVASAYCRLNRFADAKSHFAAAREAIERKYGGTNLMLAQHLANEAHNLTALEEFDAAEGMLARSLAIIEAKAGGNHPLSVVARSNLARVRLTRGDIHGAADAARGTIELAERRFGVDHVVTSLVALRVGWIHERLGHINEAQAAFERSDASLTASAGEDDPRRWRTLAAMGNIAVLRGDNARGEALLRDAAGRMGGDQSADTLERAVVELRWGRAQIATGLDVDSGTDRARAAAAVLHNAGQSWEFVQPEVAPFVVGNAGLSAAGHQ